MRRHFTLFLLALAAGCGGSNTHDAADMTAPDLAPLVGTLCTDARADVWALPISKSSQNGAFQVSLLASQASPPLIGDLTQWTIQIADAQGVMLDAATIAVKMWMPDHGHGSSVTATATPASTPGQYTITPLYLFMAGYWTVTLTITNGAISDSVVFSVCLAG